MYIYTNSFVTFTFVFKTILAQKQTFVIQTILDTLGQNFIKKEEPIIGISENKYDTRTGVADLMFDQSKFSFSFQMIVKYW